MSIIAEIMGFFTSKKEGDLGQAQPPEQKPAPVSGQSPDTGPQGAQPRQSQQGNDDPGLADLVEGLASLFSSSQEETDER